MTVLYSDVIRSTIASMNDVGNLIDASAVIYGGTSGGSADAQTITTSPTVTTISAGLRVSFIAGFTNATTTPVINLNATGSVTVKRFDGGSCFASDIVAGSTYIIMFTGSFWYLLNPACIWQDYTPTWTGFSVNPSNYIARYKVDLGRICTVAIGVSTSGTSNTTGFQISLPVTAKTLTNGQWGCVPWSVTDNGAALTTPSQAAIISAGTTIILAKSISGTGGAWTAANGKSASLVISYEV